MHTPLLGLSMQYNGAGERLTQARVMFEMS